MKLKAPEGVGEPCVAGVAIVPCGGVYDVEPATAALLIECFGFVEVEPETMIVGEAAPDRPGEPGGSRRGKPILRKA
jgi:hypothetical protein